MSCLLLALALGGAIGCGRAAPEQRTQGVAAASAAQAVGSSMPKAGPPAQSVRLDRDFIELELPFGEERSAELRLLGPDARKTQLAIQDAAGLGDALSLLPASAEQAPGVALRVRGSSVGIHVGRVTLATGLATPTELAFNYTLRVQGTLSVTPTNPTFHLGAKDSSRVVEVRSSAPGFRLNEVETVGPFAASFQRAPDGSGYRVRVRVVPHQLPVSEHGVSGMLRLISSDPAEPRKELPLLGLGRPPR